MLNDLKNTFSPIVVKLCKNSDYFKLNRNVGIQNQLIVLESNDLGRHFLTIRHVCTQLIFFLFQTLKATIQKKQPQNILQKREYFLLQLLLIYRVNILNVIASKKDRFWYSFGLTIIFGCGSLY